MPVTCILVAVFKNLVALALPFIKFMDFNNKNHKGMKCFYLLLKLVLFVVDILYVFMKKNKTL